MKIRTIAAFSAVVLFLALLFGCTESPKPADRLSMASSVSVTNNPLVYYFGPYKATTSTIPEQTLLQFGIESGSKSYDVQFSIAGITSLYTEVDVNHPDLDSVYAVYNQQVVTTVQWLAFGGYTPQILAAHSNNYEYTYGTSNYVVMSDNEINSLCTGRYYLAALDLYLHTSGSFSITNIPDGGDVWYVSLDLVNPGMTNTVPGQLEGRYVDSLTDSGFAANVSTVCVERFVDYIVTNEVSYIETNFTPNVTSVTLSTAKVNDFHARSNFSDSWFRVKITAYPGIYR